MKINVVIFFLISMLLNPISEQLLFAKNLNPFFPIGNKITITTTEGLRTVSFFKFDRNGNFYMGFTSGKMVLKYNADGQYIGKIELSSVGTEEIPFPLDVAFDRSGNVFIIATWKEGNKSHAGIFLFKDLNLQKIIRLQSDTLFVRKIVIDENDQIFVLSFDAQEKTDYWLRKVDREGRAVDAMFPLPPGLDLQQKLERFRRASLPISKGQRSLLFSFPHQALKVRPDRGEEREIPLTQGSLKEKAKRTPGPMVDDLIRSAFQTEEGLLIVQGWLSAAGRNVQDYCNIYDAQGNLLREFNPKEAGLGYEMARDEAGYFYFLEYDRNSGNFILTKTELRMDR